MKKPSLKRSIGKTKRKVIKTSATELVKTEPLVAGQLLPLVVKPAVDGVDLVGWAQENPSFIKTNLLKHGGILFRDFHITSPEQFEAFIAVTSTGSLEYRERSSPRSQVSGNIYTSTDHPADQKIFLHNENSYAHTWPQKIYFYCHVMPTEGGETPIADSRRIFQRLPANIKTKFMEKGVMYVRNFGEGLGLPWQTVFQTEDKAVVEAYCRDKKYDFEWKPNNGLRTRRVGSAVVKHPETAESIWFNHATFFHVTTLEPTIRDALLSQFAPEDLPNNTYYGDGSTIEPAVLDTLRQLYDEETVAFPWQKGDIMMLDNMMVAHGRSPYSGPRQILTGMADPISLQELL